MIFTILKYVFEKTLCNSYTLGKKKTATTKYKPQLVPGFEKYTIATLLRRCIFPIRSVNRDAFRNQIAISEFQKPWSILDVIIPYKVLREWEGFFSGDSSIDQTRNERCRADRDCFEPVDSDKETFLWADPRYRPIHRMWGSISPSYLTDQYGRRCITVIGNDVSGFKQLLQGCRRGKAVIIHEPNPVSALLTSKLYS